MIPLLTITNRHRVLSRAWMSFLRHEQIYQSDVLFFAPGAKEFPASPRPHRLDESATGYSLAGCSPALPASASPAGLHAVP